jgi:hypothetical protein
VFNKNCRTESTYNDVQKHILGRNPHSLGLRPTVGLPNKTQVGYFELPVVSTYNSVQSETL